MSFAERLLSNIAEAYAENEPVSNYQLELVEHFLNALESGQIRCASKHSGAWHVDTRVKEGILLAFRLGQPEKVEIGPLSFIDKANLWPRNFELSDQVRLVPASSTVRRGAYVGPKCTLMPPSFVNIGAYVGSGSMVDSHALVGSCAQVGEGVHISAGCQIGGVLEPIGALPVIIEDNCLLGGNSGVYEGTFIGEGAVLGAGVILTRSTKIYDLVRKEIISAPENGVLSIPERAVLVPGARALNSDFARSHGLSVAAPMIIKYRDDKTDAKIKLEDLLR